MSALHWAAARKIPLWSPDTGEVKKSDDITGQITEETDVLEKEKKAWWILGRLGGWLRDRLDISTTAQN